MKIKVFTLKGYMIISVSNRDDIKTLADKYNRLEYVS
jgi:hypothetical protein